ncbi:MAG: multidrug ABC transporter ATP-binding protein, partial [Pirellulales bacterium]
TVLNVRVADAMERAAEFLQQQPHVDSVEQRDDVLVVTLVENHHDYSDLAAALVNGGYRLTLFKEDELNLETAFMALTKGITA